MSLVAVYYPEEVSMRVPMGDDDDDVEKAEEWDSEEEVSIGYLSE